MAIVKRVWKWSRIVPVRFARAPHATDPTVEAGDPDANAPDPDDRGFLPHRNGSAILPVGLDGDLAEAALPETRVRLIRVDMENAGDLFVTSNNPARVEVTQPAAGTALPRQQKMMIKFKAKSDGEAYLHVRFGARDGPIVHRLCVVVNPLRKLRIAAHVPTVNGTPFVKADGTTVPARSTRTDAQIRALVDAAKQIYIPYGILLTLDAAIDRAGVLACANQGFVNDLTNEFELATALNRVAGAVNMYFVPQIGGLADVDSVGGSATRAKKAPDTFGSLISDMPLVGQTLAHELGHVLNLVNDSGKKFVHVNTKIDPALPGTGSSVRDDIVSRRRLMWAYTNFLPAAGMAYRDDVGYGADRPGSMLTIKQFTADPTDLEMKEVQATTALLAAQAGP